MSLEFYSAVLSLSTLVEQYAGGMENCEHGCDSAVVSLLTVYS